MKQALQVIIEIEKNDRTYIFSMPYGAPIGEAHDAAHECLQEIVKMAKNAAEKMKQSETPDLT
jgi:hypothetical protein